MLSVRLEAHEEEKLEGSVRKGSALPYALIHRGAEKGKFSEICIQRCAYNAASEPKDSILNASTLDDRLLHFVVLDRYTGSRMLHCHGSLGSDHARFLRGFALARKHRR